jgi:hypothetical protein
MKRMIVAVVLIAVLSAGIWLQRTRTQAQPASEGMRTARVTRGTLTSNSACRKAIT